MAAETTQQMVTLTSSDDRSFELPVDAAMIAGMIKEMLDPEDGLPESIKPIDLVKINGETLELVVAFLRKYHDEPMGEIQIPLNGKRIEEVSAVTLPFFCVVLVAKSCGHIPPSFSLSYVSLFLQFNRSSNQSGTRDSLPT